MNALETERHAKLAALKPGDDVIVVSSRVLTDSYAVKVVSSVTRQYGRTIRIGDEKYDEYGVERGTVFGHRNRIYPADDQKMLSRMVAAEAAERIERMAHRVASEMNSPEFRKDHPEIVEAAYKALEIAVTGNVKRTG